MHFLFFVSVAWEERKESGTELAATACNCSNYVTIDNSDYCEKWSCEGVSMAKCTDADDDCGSLKIIGIDTEYYDTCCYTTCSDNHCTDHEDKKNIRHETQECVCTKTVVETGITDNVTTYCQEWQCIDESTGKYGYKEFESHVCHTRNVQYGYCEDWQWQTDDYESWENTACTCSQTNATTGGLETCMLFECKEKGSLKVWPELAFIALSMGIHHMHVAFFLFGQELAFTDCMSPITRIVRLAFYAAGAVVAPLCLGGIPTFALSMAGNLILGIALYILMPRANRNQYIGKWRRAFGDGSWFTKWCYYDEEEDRPFAEAARKALEDFEEEERLAKERHAEWMEKQALEIQALEQQQADNGRNGRSAQQVAAVGALAAKLSAVPGAPPQYQGVEMVERDDTNL